MQVQKATLGTGGRGPQKKKTKKTKKKKKSAVYEAFGNWKTVQTASFLVGSESDVRHWGPWPAGPVRPSGPCCFWCGEGAVFEAFGGWKTAQTASFLVGSESDVRQWGPWRAGPVRPSGPCCLAVAQAPFWVRQLVFL